MYQIRWGWGEGSSRCAGEIAVGAPKISFLLQPLHESHGVVKVRAQVVRVGQGENGGDAAAQHELDRGPVLETGSRYIVSV